MTRDDMKMLAPTFVAIAVIGVGLAFLDRPQEPQPNFGTWHVPATRTPAATPAETPSECEMWTIEVAGATDTAYVDCPGWLPSVAPDGTLTMVREP